jgi:hypothetical protein
LYSLPCPIDHFLLPLHLFIPTITHPRTVTTGTVIAATMEWWRDLHPTDACALALVITALAAATEEEESMTSETMVYLPHSPAVSASTEVRVGDIGYE